MLEIIEGAIDYNYPEIRGALNHGATPMDVAKAILSIVEMYGMVPPKYKQVKTWPQGDNVIYEWEKE